MPNGDDTPPPGDPPTFQDIADLAAFAQERDDGTDPELTETLRRLREGAEDLQKRFEQ